MHAKLWTGNRSAKQTPNGTNTRNLRSEIIFRFSVIGFFCLSLSFLFHFRFVKVNYRYRSRQRNAIFLALVIVNENNTEHNMI